MSTLQATRSEEYRVYRHETLLAVTNICLPANNYTVYEREVTEEAGRKASLVLTSFMSDFFLSFFFYICCDGTKSAVTGLMHTQSKPSGEDLTVLSDHRRVKEFGMQMIRGGCC